MALRNHVDAPPVRDSEHALLADRRAKLAEHEAKLAEANARLVSLDLDASSDLVVAAVRDRDVLIARIAALRAQVDVQAFSLGLEADGSALSTSAGIQVQDEMASLHEERRKRAEAAARVQHVKRLRLTDSEIASRNAEIGKLLRQLRTEDDALTAKVKADAAEIAKRREAMKELSTRALDLELQVHNARLSATGPNPTFSYDFAHGSRWLLADGQTPLDIAAYVLRTLR